MQRVRHPCAAYAAEGLGEGFRVAINDGPNGSQARRSGLRARARARVP